MTMRQPSENRPVAEGSDPLPHVPSNLRQLLPKQTRVPAPGPGQGQAQAISGARVDFNRQLVKRHPANELKAESRARGGLHCLDARALENSEKRQHGLATLAAVPILKSVPKAQVGHCMESGDLQLVFHPRDTLLDTSDSIYIIISGQLAIAYFGAEEHTRETRLQREFAAAPQSAAGGLPTPVQLQERHQRQRGPLIRLARMNLAKFSDNEVADLQKLRIPDKLQRQYGRDPDGKERVLALYTVASSLLVRMRPQALQRLKAFDTQIENRLRNATVLSQSLLSSFAESEEPRLEIADFYIRHGKSVGNLLRIRDLDKCIECFQCEAACEERYGKQRLFLNGKIKGALDFVNCCQTCEDPRCIDACADEAITFRADKGEVVIDETRCTGCGRCALACPYDAIVMADKQHEPALWNILTKDGARPLPKLKHDRFPNKCDHCIGYEDQACITACPTGALFDDRRDPVFPDLSASYVSVAEQGFGKRPAVQPEKYYKADVFYNAEGLRERQAPTLSENQRRGWRLIWAVSLLVLCLFYVEAGLRVLAPGSSLAYLWGRLWQRGSHPTVVALSVRFLPTSGLGWFLGWLGALLCGAALLYSACIRIPAITRFAQRLRQRALELPESRQRRIFTFIAELLAMDGIGVQQWFRIHVLCGVTSVLCLLLHSAGRIAPGILASADGRRLSAQVTAVPAIVGFWLLTWLVLLGLGSRYLVPRTLRASGAAALDAYGRLRELRQSHAGILVADERWEKQMWTRFDHVLALCTPHSRPVATALMALISDGLGHRRFLRQLRRQLEVSIPDRKLCDKIADLYGKIAAYHRMQTLIPILQPSLGWLVKLHILIAILFVVCAGIHVFFEIFIR